MNKTTTKTITPDSAEWNQVAQFAPTWAASALVEDKGKTLTFRRELSLPSIHRDGDSLVVLRVEQAARFSPGLDSFVTGEVWISTALDGATLWADYRRDEVATELRALADALAPLVSDAKAGA
jgi:hypothetical protein